MEKICIYTEYITLGQLLKITDTISSGGEAKIFLSNNYAIINGEKDNRRGRKLYKGYRIIINNKEYIIE
jgi:S4 domain protein YaaA